MASKAVAMVTGVPSHWPNASTLVGPFGTSHRYTASSGPPRLLVEVVVDVEVVVVESLVVVDVEVEVDPGL
jgi:hypothetical protein